MNQEEEEEERDWVPWGLFAFAQLAILGIAGWMIYDGGGTAPTGPFQVPFIDAAVPHLWVLGGLFIVQLLLVGDFLLWRARKDKGDPERVASWKARFEAARAQNAKLEEELVATQAELKRVQEETRRLVGRVPNGILDYYRRGVDTAAGRRELERTLRREENAWQALASTFRSDALSPLFTALRELLQQHEQGVHHHSTAEVAAVLAQVSRELREDDWFAKALRWMEARYG